MGAAETGRFVRIDPAPRWSRHQFSVQEVLDACRQVTGHPIPAVERDRRHGDPPTLVASNIRARELLGWTPQLDLHRLVADAWAFLRDGTASP